MSGKETEGSSSKIQDSLVIIKEKKKTEIKKILVITLIFLKN